MDLVDKVSKLLLALKPRKNQAGLADAIGMKASNLSKVLNRQENRIFKAEHISLMAIYLETTAEYLLGKGNQVPTKIVPIIGRSSCGIPKEYILDDYETIPVPTELFKDGMYAIEAEGDSMSPKINDGDILYCVPNQTIDSGKIVHYWLNGESGIKRYKINEAGTIISLVPINSEYDIITIHCDENADLCMSRVVGRFDKDF